MQQQQFAFICTKFPENFNRNLFAGNKKGVRQQPNSFIFSNLYFYLLRLISIPPEASQKTCRFYIIHSMLSGEKAIERVH